MPNTLRPISSLPLELFTTILTHLPPKSIISSSRVSKAWRSAIQRTCKVSWALTALSPEHRAEGDWRLSQDDNYALFVDCVYTLHCLRTGLPRTALLYRADQEWNSLVVSSSFVALWKNPNTLAVYERLALGNTLGICKNVAMDQLVGMPIRRPAFVCNGLDTVVVAFKKAWDGPSEPEDEQAFNNYLCSINLSSQTLNWLTPLRAPQDSDYESIQLRPDSVPLVPHFIFPAQILGPTLVYSNDQFERIPFSRANQLRFTYTVLDLRTGRALATIPDNVIGDQKCTCCPSINLVRALSKSRYVRDHLATQPKYGLWFARGRFLDGGKMCIEIRSCISGELIGEAVLERDGVELEKLYFLKIKILDEGVSRDPWTGKRVLRSKIVLGIQQEGSSVAFDMDDLHTQFRGPRSKNPDWIKLWTVDVQTTIHTNHDLDEFFPQVLAPGVTRLNDPFTINMRQEKLDHFNIPTYMPRERYAFTFYNASPKVSILTSCKKDGILRTRIVEFKPSPPPPSPPAHIEPSPADSEHPTGASSATPMDFQMANPSAPTSPDADRFSTSPPSFSAAPSASTSPTQTRRNSISLPGSPTQLLRRPLSAAKSALTPLLHLKKAPPPPPVSASKLLPDGCVYTHYTLGFGTMLSKLPDWRKNSKTRTEIIGDGGDKVGSWGKVRFVPDGGEGGRGVGVGVVVFSQGVVFF